MNKNKKYTIYCISCGKEIGEFREKNKDIDIICEKCNSNFSVSSPLDSNFFILRVYYFANMRVSYDNRLENSDYPQVFCPYSGTKGKIQVIDPKIYKFGCTNEKCKKSFILLFDL